MVIMNFWSIVLDDHWSKKIYRPQMIVDVRVYTHLKWSCWWRCDGTESEGPDREGKGQATIWGLVSGEVLNNINFINNIQTQVIIADISLNRHKRPWCTFLMPEYFLAKTLCQRERKIFANFGFLAEIYALAGVLLQAILNNAVVFQNWQTSGRQVINAISTLCRCTWSWKKMEQRSMMRSISRRCLTTPCSCFFSCRCASKERKCDLYSIYCHCKFKTVVKVYSSWIRFRGEWNKKERQFSKLWSQARSSFCTNTNNDFQQMWFSCKAFCHYFAKAGLRPVRARLERLGQNTVLGCSQRLALRLWHSTWLKWSFFVTRVFRHSLGVPTEL